jgi:hypothetical protein
LEQREVFGSTTASRYLESDLSKLIHDGAYLLGTQNKDNAMHKKYIMQLEQPKKLHER